MPPKKPPCGNPLFLSWIEELRDQARDKGTKAFDVYSKAARSLSACPVTYARPRDLVCLVGIGPKTVSILEGKWQKHCEENGLPPPGTPPKIPAKSKKSMGTAADSGTGSEAEDPEPPKAKKRKTPALPKSYIPIRGSGGYGILLGLLLLVPNPQMRTQVFVTKSELIRAAQAYSDSSYEHSEKGTYFNAWNNMKTLIGKGYVYTTGNPHKFCLTEEGYEVACAVRQLRPEMAGETRYPFIHETLADVARTGSLPGAPPSMQVPAARSRIQATVSSSTGESSKQPSPRRSSGSGKFQFWYIDSAGSRVQNLDSAMVRLDPEDYINIRKVEFLVSQKTHPFAEQLKLVESASSGPAGSLVPTLFGYIIEEGAPPNCSKFDDIPVQLPTPAGKSRLVIDDHLVDDDWVAPPVSAPVPDRASPATRPPLPLPRQVTGSTFSRTASAPAGPSNYPSPAQLAAEAAARRAAQAVAAGPTRTHSATADFALPSKPRPPAPRLSSHIPLRTPLLHEDDNESPPQPNVNLPDFSPADAIIYPAGTYEIVLVLDTREVESKTSRDKFAQALMEKGVRVETRALRLGDMCWIAKRKDGIGGDEDECVLDYVVERKRLDDLCSSIKDGRYTEQCFRLGNSCINNIYYIVEDFHTGHHMEYSGLQIMTAKSQIQVHNRFFLKETHKLTETIQFLTTMTGIIISRHAQQDIRVIPTRYLSRSSYSTLQTHLKKTHSSEVYHTSFEAYQELNDKSASKTLREAFARMLFCVKGMSAERVSAVLDEFDTPRGLWDAMKAYEEKSEVMELAGESVESAGKGGKKKGEKRGKELFFADRLQGEGRRKVGDALSRDLWRAFMGGSSRQ